MSHFIYELNIKLPPHMVNPRVERLIKYKNNRRHYWYRRPRGHIHIYTNTLI